MLYERTAISGKPEELIRHELDALRNEDRLTPDLVFKDPYFLDFLGLRDRYLERIWKMPFCGSWINCGDTVATNYLHFVLTPSRQFPGYCTENFINPEALF